MVTFKLFGPSDGCRRVTWTGIPGLRAISDAADGLVEIPADKRAFTYIDSEGDRVDIKTDQDVNEAVRDARQAGVKTVKIRIRPTRRQWGGRHGSEPCQPDRRGGATDKKPCRATRPCGFQRARCHVDGRGGLFDLWSGFPHTRVKISRGSGDDFCTEWSDAVNTLFSQIFIADPDASEAAATSKDCKASSKKQEGKGQEDEGDKRDDDEAEAVERSGNEATLLQSEAPMPSPPDETPASVITEAESEDGSHALASTAEEADQGTPEPQPAASLVVTIEEDSDARLRQQDEPAEEDYEIVDERHASSATLPASPSLSDSHLDDADEGASGDGDAETSAKLKLLRDMGFNLPLSVARNMIEEMGGRMDLIVRALVANNK